MDSIDDIGKVSEDDEENEGGREEPRNQDVDGQEEFPDSRSGRVPFDFLVVRIQPTMVAVAQRHRRLGLLSFVLKSIRRLAFKSNL
jgi:hypothetical protein